MSALYESALQDVDYNTTKLPGYLNDILNKIDKFIDTYDDEICNEHELNYELNSIINSKGIFSCLLGGKNTGKSTILSAFADYHNTHTTTATNKSNNTPKILYIDLSKHSNIITGFIKVLKPWQYTGFKRVIHTCMHTIHRLIHGTDSIQSNIYTLNLDHSFRQSPKYQQLSTILDSLACLPNPITIVIDEVDMAIRDEEEKEEVQGSVRSTGVSNTGVSSRMFSSFLQHMVASTKQLRKVSSHCISRTYVYIITYFHSYLCI